MQPSILEILYSKSSPYSVLMNSGIRRTRWRYRASGVLCSSFASPTTHDLRVRISFDFKSRGAVSIPKKSSPPGSCQKTPISISNLAGGPSPRASAHNSLSFLRAAPRGVDRPDSHRHTVLCFTPTAFARRTWDHPKASLISLTKSGPGIYSNSISLSSVIHGPTEKTIPKTNKFHFAVAILLQLKYIDNAAIAVLISYKKTLPSSRQTLPTGPATRKAAMPNMAPSAPSSKLESDPAPSAASPTFSLSHHLRNAEIKDIDAFEAALAQDARVRRLRRAIARTRKGDPLSDQYGGN